MCESSCSKPVSSKRGRDSASAQHVAQGSVVRTITSGLSLLSVLTRSPLQVFLAVAVASTAPTGSPRLSFLVNGAEFEGVSSFAFLVSCACPIGLCTLAFEDDGMFLAHLSVPSPEPGELRFLQQGRNCCRNVGVTRSSHDALDLFKIVKLCRLSKFRYVFKELGRYSKF